MEFDPKYGEAVEVAPGISRIVAPNASAFTFHGTNSYILGEDRLAVIDPGPIDEGHFDALMAAINGRQVSDIFITHTHADHSPLTNRLVEITGARTHGYGPHIPARELVLGEINPLDASADISFHPDNILRDGDIVEGDGWALKALHTPGHTQNHMAFALEGTDWLFPGDHVMAWATSIVAPPDGSMREYMASLEHLLAQSQSKYLPGHGGRLENAHKFMRGLRAHRKMRERAILEQVKAGRKTIPAMVQVIYASTDKRLHGAAGLSVLAHLEDLVSQGKVVCDGHPLLDSQYRPAAN